MMLIKTLTYRDFKSNQLEELWKYYSKSRSLDIKVLVKDKKEAVVIFTEINEDEHVVPLYWIKEK